MKDLIERKMDKSAMTKSEQYAIDLEKALKKKRIYTRRNLDELKVWNGNNIATIFMDDRTGKVSVELKLRLDGVKPDPKSIEAMLKKYGI